ncbi:hypothetical protein DK28_0205590 [Peptococcaceae bacterium SCADC1_2_3]|nr:hypothetical protein DK28_0205590 [Peptococcaceae bacterium SCADC1_2_3]KFI36213.1 hypothetical protein HY00_06285 [Peptococcaceae bacterium SCADC1_2_3]
MKVLYRKLFLKDLKKLSKQPIYDQIVELVFTVLSEITTLQKIHGVKSMRKYPRRYRIRVGNYLSGTKRKPKRISKSTESVLMKL